MRFLRAILSIIIVGCTMCALVSCVTADSSSQTSETLTKEDLILYKQNLVSATDAEYTPWDGTAYWTENGSVWHKDRGCSYLTKAQPEEILFGTADDAQQAGKERACSRCGS